MPFKDLLIHLDSYPDPTPLKDVDEAVAFAAMFHAKLTALTVGISIPLESNRIADYLIGLSDLVAEEEGRSEASCKGLLAEFTTRAKAAHVYGGANLESADLYDVPEVAAREARTRDLCLMPLGGRYSGQREVAQAAIFGSGRPVLMYDGRTSRFAKGLETAVVAWDGSACAARAVAEAMPILVHAKVTRVLIVLGEKASVHSGLAPEIVRHLKSHGVDAVVDEVAAKGRSIGAAFEAYLKSVSADVLVMGAYGHSRLREFILGGATEHMLWKGAVPTFLSH